MLKKIKFKEYKGYKEAEIDLKPITILLGANSSGKSSILQLLLMFEQTLNLDQKYDSALKLNGKHTNLGETENIFRNKDTSKNLTFSFDLEPNRFSSFHQSEIRRIKRNIESEIIDIYYKLRKFEELIENTNIRSIQFKYKDINQDNILIVIKEIQSLKRKISKINFDEKESSIKDLPDSKLFQKRIRYSSNEIKELLNIPIAEYKDSIQLFDAISEHLLSSFRIEFDINYSKNKKTLIVSRISIKSNNIVIIEYEKERKSGQIKHVLNSDIFEKKILNKYRVKFGKNVEFDNLILSAKDDVPNSARFRKTNINNEMFCTNILRLFSVCSFQLKNAFNSNRINYISPLRAFPKRYYFLDESNVSSSLDSIDGDNLTEVLKKEKDVSSKVNKWLNKFDLSVSIEDVKEVIHRLKIKQNGLNLDITDVGFGISQVLPIIIQGFLSKKNSLTIIEQPEIHLHPMMQAELADLFIDVVNTQEKNNDKVLLIETHSEAILKRLRRRIAEGKIKNSDVAIYFIKGRTNKNSSSTIERLPISETGAFDWPKEFYSTDYEDTTEFLKYQ